MILYWNKGTYWDAEVRTSTWILRGYSSICWVGKKWDNAHKITFDLWLMLLRSWFSRVITDVWLVASELGGESEMWNWSLYGSAQKLYHEDGNTVFVAINYCFLMVPLDFFVVCELFWGKSNALNRPRSCPATWFGFESFLSITVGFVTCLKCYKLTFSSFILKF